MRNAEEKPDPAQRQAAGYGRESEERRRRTNPRDQSQGMTEMTPASEVEARAGGTKQEGIQGIVMDGNCNRRCWLAHGNICRCSCGGENHSAMRPGSLRLRSPSDGQEMQTIMAGLAPETETE